MEKKVRKSNIELLRILLIVMVIVLHFNNGEMGGGFANASGTNYRMLQLFEAFSICAVDTFVLISAYFLSGTQKRNMLKPISLIGLTSGYKLVTYLVQVFYLKQAVFTLRDFIFNVIPNNWFVILFCVLYIISPYINILMDNLDKEQFKKCLITLVLLFAVYPTVMETLAQLVLGSPEIAGMGTVTTQGSMSGYTIVNFVLMYFIGGYLRKYPPKSSKWLYALCYVAFVLCDFAFAHISSGYTSYANVFVIAEAVTLFLAFYNINIGYSKVINTISGSVFGVYILHTCGLFIGTFWSYFNIPAMVNMPIINMLGHMVVAVGAMFVVCLAIDMVRRCILKLLQYCIHK